MHGAHVTRPGVRGYPRTAWRAAACLALALLLAPGRAVRGQQDTLLAEAAVQLDIQHGPSDIVAALVYDGTLMLPVHRFLEMSEIRVTAFDLRDSLVFMLEPGARRVQFHPGRGELLLGDSVISIGPGDAVWWDGDLFAAAAVFDRVFGVAVRIEWMDLTVFVGRSASLPVVRRARRERQQALLRRPSAVEALEYQLPRAAADGAVFNWAFTGSTGARDDFYNLDLGLGAQAGGGSLTVRPQFWRMGGESGVELRAAWERAWPRQRWLRQVRVGDVPSNGRRAQLVRGAVVTNAPFIRSSEFDVERIIGRLPTGWDVELYDRGRLIGYGEVDALGAFSIPLNVRYGQNPYELVMYGPAGEVVRETRTVRVPFSRLPGRQLEYAVAVGQCRYQPCDGLVSADARYGLSNRVTLQGGWDVFARETGGALWQPYAAASAAVLRSLSLTGEAVVNGHLRGAVEYEPSPDLRVTAGHTSYAEAGQLFTPALIESSRTEGTVLWRPGALRRSLYLQGFGVRSAGSAFTRTIARASATAQLGRLRYTFGMRHDGFTRDTLTTTRFAVDAGADAVLQSRRPWLSGTSIRAEASVEPADGLAALAASVGRRVGRVLRADVGVGWFRVGGYGLSIALTTALPGPRVGLRTQSNSQLGTTGMVFVNGSAVYDRDGAAVRWTDGGDLGRGGVSGLLFLDENANGRRDEGERGIAGIPVHVGGWYAETDAEGRFGVWDLFPFEALDIAVDSLAFDDPLLVPPAPLIQVRPLPNSFITVEIPVTVGAEVLGYVVLESQGVAGIPVLLRNLDTGAEIRTLTFSDGAFYRAGVPPGEYEVALPEAVAEQLGVYALPLHLVVPPGSGEKRIDNVLVELERVER
jgi:hypothetical protein